MLGTHSHTNERMHSNVQCETIVGQKLNKYCQRLSVDVNVCLVFMWPDWSGH